MKNNHKKQLHIFHRMHSAIHIVLMVIAVIALALLVTFLRPGSLQAGPTDNVSGWAWSGVAGGGWISMNCINDSSCVTVDYGVHIDDASGVWSGSGWSSNLGWIDFDSVGSCGSSPVTDLSSGVTTGFAKVRSSGSGGFSGCINMAGNGAGQSGGVLLDVDNMSPTYGQMSGYAWSGDDVAAGAWTTDGIADVGIGWIDFSNVIVDLEIDPTSDVTLYVGGECNGGVEFTWDLFNVDESTCELFYQVNTNPGVYIPVPNFDASSQPLTEVINGPLNSILKFGLVCDDALTGDPVSSPAQQLTCESEPVVLTECNDDIDNDLDGFTDMDDEVCQCTNGVHESGTCLTSPWFPGNPLNQTEGEVPIYIES